MEIRCFRCERILDDDCVRDGGLIKYLSDCIDCSTTPKYSTLGINRASVWREKWKNITGR